MSEFRMPSLGADMEAGTLVEWLVKVGDPVKRGDILAVVETQKGAIEIEVFEDGVLEERLAQPGAVLPVGAPMARIRTLGESAEERSPARATPTEEPREPTAAHAPLPTAHAPHASARASPAARKLAQALGVDLASIKGGGPGGAITRADVAASAAALGADKRPDFTAMRRAIAAAMARSKREIPHYYLSHTADIGDSQAWLTAYNAERTPSDRLLMGALFVKAAAMAAHDYPEFNGFYEREAFRPSQAVHAGIAIAIRGVGLAAPAIHDAADLDLAQLMSRMRDLVRRVRAGRFRSSEIADPTITITSLGDRGVEAVWGVIYPPQVAIVGFGRIVTRPWATGGSIGLRPTVCITLAADHRVSDGHRGALFLERIGQLLAAPEAL